MLAAVALAPLAVRAASVLAMSGPGALRLLFPAVSLVQAHLPATLAPEQRDTAAEWVMWSQLPAYGLLLSLAAWRHKLFPGIVLVLAVHAGAVTAALLVR